LSAGGAIGAGLGGLAALAALLLLFLLRKKTKSLQEPEETVSDTMTVTNEEDEVYISEYGLSDGVRPVDDHDELEDLPRAAPIDLTYDSDLQNASEHNPDDFGDPDFDPDEA
jgi:hypothetical protein